MVIWQRFKLLISAYLSTVFDGIKLDFYNAFVATHLLQSLFHFTFSGEKSSGEVKKYEMEYCGLKFTVYTTDRIMVEGSLHIFYNMYFAGTRHNYDDFSLTKLTKAINALCEILQVSASEISVRNIEFGHNIKLKNNVNTKKLIENFIAYDNRRPFDIKTFKGKGYLIEYVSSQARVKIYDKGKQYNLSVNMIRIEKQVKTMQNQFKSAVFLNDLLKKDFWLVCQQGLLLAFDKCLFINSKISCLSYKEQKLLQKVKNPSFWESLTHAQRSYYSKSKLPELNSKYKLWEGKIQLREELIDSYQKLIDS